MAPLIRVEGTWPGPVTVTAGWFRARARPWNETVPEPMVRLDRGGAEFLTAVTRRLEEMGPERVYSPALYPDSTNVWRRSGFQPDAELAIMERSLSTGPENEPTHAVTSVKSPRWEEVVHLDATAFEGFWKMSTLGLSEAYETNRSTTLLTTRVEDELAGYAIVGTQWGVTYLHRIAVHPDHGGKGLGSSLMSASIAWGRAHGGRTMVLNVRSVNDRAQRLYERCGFTHTGTKLLVLRHEAG
ncbi:MAG: GNAT family N-acetyltransferase [Acidimicrobiia bacterium]